MKSIKEKSLEVFPEHCNYFISSDNERKRIGFEAGAKAVLEEIEKAYHKGGAVEVVELIEELKQG